MKINFPNSLIIFRIILVPIIIFLLFIPSIIELNFLYWKVYWTDVLAGIFFLLASFSDFVDGWYARKFNKITTFGKLFDPLADKILINSTLIIFCCRGIIPVIFVIIFICRDILVDGLRMLLASEKSIALSADKWGKLKTIFQMIGLTLLFFVHFQNDTELNNFFNLFDWTQWQSIISILIVCIALFFSILSGFNYYVKGFKLINKEEN